MKKKFICTVCGYIYEGTEAPEKCPICKAPASKFKEMEDTVDDDLTFATVHVLGQAYKDGVNEEVIKGLKRLTSVMLSRRLTMLLVLLSCWVRFWVIPRATLRLVSLQRRVHARISSALPSSPRSRVLMLSTILFTRWLRTRLATVQASLVSTRDISSKSTSRFSREILPWADHSAQGFFFITPQIIFLSPTDFTNLHRFYFPIIIRMFCVNL